MKLYQFIQQEYARGQRDALTIQEAARAAFPYLICGLDYVQKIMRALAREEAK